MARFLTGPNGRLLLVGGRALLLASGAGAAEPAPSTTLSIALTPFYLASANTKFNVHPTAASGDTEADAPFVFTYTGDAPASVEGRIVDAGGAAVPGADWKPLTGATVNDANKTGLAYLPGLRVGAGYRREIRVAATSGTLTDIDTANFNVGPMILPWGQSNMVGTLTGGAAGSGNVPGTSVSESTYFLASAGAFFGQSGYYYGNGTPIGNYNVILPGAQSMIRLIGKRLKAKYGRDVGLSMNPWARNSTHIGQFTPAAMLTGTGTTNGTVGFSSPKHVASADYRVVAFHQGETWWSGQPIATAERLTQLKAFCQMHIDHVAQYGRAPSQLTFLFAIMGVGSPSHMEVLRGAVLQLVTYGATQGWDVRIGWNCIDLDVGTDLLHLSADSQLKSNRRLVEASQNVLDPSGVPFGAKGPSLTGAVSRAGDNVTFTVAQNGGTALAAKDGASPITGWYANTAADFSGTDLAVSNVTILSSTQIRITVTGAPVTFYVKHCGGKHGTAQSNTPNIANLIYDNRVYPTGADPSEQFTGLPLLPTPDAIVVN